MNSSAASEMAVPAVNKATQPENAPETSVPAQEIGSPEEPGIQNTGNEPNCDEPNCDEPKCEEQDGVEPNSDEPNGGEQDGGEPNGVAVTQDITKQTEEIVSVAIPLSGQGLTADPAESSASFPSPEACVPSEAPISLEQPIHEEAAPSEDVQNQESVVEESCSPDAKQISVEEASGEELCSVAAKNLDDQKQCVPEDITANAEDVKANDEPKTVVEGPTLDAALPDVNVDVATQNEKPERKEPVFLSKAIQSKGTSKIEGPPLSTCHLSGWFLIYEK